MTTLQSRVASTICEIRCVCVCKTSGVWPSIRPWGRCCLTSCDSVSSSLKLNPSSSLSTVSLLLVPLHSSSIGRSVRDELPLAKGSAGCRPEPPAASPLSSLGAVLVLLQQV